MFICLRGSDASSRVSRPVLFLTCTMNSIVSRFASSSSAHNIKKVTEEDDNVSDAMWASSAGFGNLGQSGIPSFQMPQVADVSRPSILAQDRSSQLTPHSLAKSPRRSCVYIQTTMPTRPVASRFSTAPPHWLSDSRVGSSSQ